MFGVPLAWVLARARFPGRSLVRALVVLPMVLPPVVGGVALLFAFQRNGGLVGEWLYDGFGFQFTFSKAGAVLAETFVAMPFLVITVEAGLRIDGPALRGRRGEPRRRPVDGVPPRHAAADRARAVSPAPRSRGRGRSASSAPPSRSPATSRAARRPCRSRSTTCSRPTSRVAIVLSLVLLAVSIVVLVVAARPLVRRPA